MCVMVFLRQILMFINNFYSIVLCGILVSNTLFQSTLLSESTKSSAAIEQGNTEQTMSLEEINKQILWLRKNPSEKNNKTLQTLLTLRYNKYKTPRIQ